MAGTEDVGDTLVSGMVRDSVSEWRRDTEGTFDRDMDEYGRYVYRKWVFIGACVAIAVLTMGAALTLGTYRIGFVETYVTIWDHFTGNIDHSSYNDSVIFVDRLPRIAVGAAAGAGLAVAGVCMQCVLKNPLADPYTTGVSSGATFGAALAITFGLYLVPGSAGLIINAFVFSLIPTALMVSLSRTERASPTMMIMAGIAVMFLFGAFTSSFKLFAEPEALQELTRWEAGSLGGVDWGDFWIMFPVVLTGSAAIMLLSRELNVMSTGDDSSRALGVNASQLRTLCLATVALMTASIVSFVGLIGFVGLVAPHVVRMFIGADNRFLIPASGAFGMALLMLADLIGRTILSPTVLQAGLVMSFVGGPLFLWMIVSGKRKVWG